MQAVGYDEGSRTLSVRFRNGLFHYQDVPPEKYAGLFESPSAGSFFATEIKPYHTATRGDDE